MTNRPKKCSTCPPPSGLWYDDNQVMILLLHFHLFTLEVPGQLHHLRVASPFGPYARCVRVPPVARLPVRDRHLQPVPLQFHIRLRRLRIGQESLDLVTVLQLPHVQRERIPRVVPERVHRRTRVKPRNGLPEHLIHLRLQTPHFPERIPGISRVGEKWVRCLSLHLPTG